MRHDRRPRVAIRRGSLCSSPPGCSTLKGPKGILLGADRPKAKRTPAFGAFGPWPSKMDEHPAQRTTRDEVKERKDKDHGKADGENSLQAVFAPALVPFLAANGFSRGFGRTRAGMPSADAARRLVRRMRKSHLSTSCPYFTPWSRSQHREPRAPAALFPATVRPDGRADGDPAHRASSARDLCRPWHTNPLGVGESCLRYACIHPESVILAPGWEGGERAYGRYSRSKRSQCLRSLSKFALPR